MPCGKSRPAASPRLLNVRSRRCSGPESRSKTLLPTRRCAVCQMRGRGSWAPPAGRKCSPRTSSVQLRREKVALAISTAMRSSSHWRDPPLPRLKAWPPQLPFTTRQPQFSRLSSEAQKERLAHLRFAPPTRATRCASVMKEPSTVSLPLCSMKVASCSQRHA